MQSILQTIKEQNDSNIPVLIMPIGFPASGKSTFLSELLNTDEINITVLGYDVITEEYQKQHQLSYKDAFNQQDPDEKRRIYNERKQNALNSGANIFIDQTNLKGVTRGKMMEEMPDYFCVGIYIPVTPEESIERCAKRKEETGKEIPTAAIWGMNAYMNPPEPAEFDILFELKNGEFQVCPNNYEDMQALANENPDFY